MSEKENIMGHVASNEGPGTHVVEKSVDDGNALVPPSAELGLGGVRSEGPQCSSYDASVDVLDLPSIYIDNSKPLVSLSTFQGLSTLTAPSSSLRHTLSGATGPPGVETEATDEPMPEPMTTATGPDLSKFDANDVAAASLIIAGFRPNMPSIPTPIVQAVSTAGKSAAGGVGAGTIKTFKTLVKGQDQVAVYRDPKFSCTYEGCTHIATKAWKLQEHLRRHMGIKKFKCSFDGCSYSSVTSYDLLVHTRAHTGEKPYRCTYEGCDYAATNSGDLTRHLRTHSGEKPYKCSVQGCSYAAAQPGALTRHLRIHCDVEKPHKCSPTTCGLGNTRSNIVSKASNTSTNNTTTA
jgi:hypothetical protein